MALVNPFLRGQYAAQEANQGAEQSNLSGLATILKIQDMVRQQQRQQAYQSAVGSLPADATPEDYLKAARPYVSPDKLATTIQGSQDRKAALEQTKALRMHALEQQAGRDSALLQLRYQNATDAREKDYWRRQMDVYNAGLAKQRSDIAAGNLYYNTGMNVPAFSGQAPTMGAPAVAPAAPQQDSGLQTILQDRPPAEQAAIAAAATGRPTNLSITPAGLVPGQGDASFQAPQGAQAVPAAPAAAPDAIPSSAPGTPATLSMAQSGGLEGRFPPVGQAAQGPVAPLASVAPGIAPLPQMPPQIAALPKAKRDAWVLQQAKGGGSDMGDFTKTGNEYLQSLPVEDQTFVKKLAAYEIDPKSLAIIGGRRERAFKMAAQYDPNFDQKNYNVMSSALRAFSSGPQGNTVRSLNVAIEHMDTAKRLGLALQNGDIPAVNAIANAYATQTGQPVPPTFNAVKDIVADEVIKGVVTGVASIQDRAGLAQKIRDSSSPAQLVSVLNGLTELLGGQVKGLKRQYEGATNRTDFESRYLTPKAQAAYNGVSGAVMPSYSSVADAMAAGHKAGDRVSIGGVTGTLK